MDKQKKTENGNIISFEEYRKRRGGHSYREDALSRLFKKDLREQEDLIGWYQFHRRFNKHKLFVHSLFEENHQAGNINPNSGFLVAFNRKQVLSHTSFVIEAVEWEKREYVLIKCAGKTYRQLSEKLSQFPVNTNYDAHGVFENFLLTTNKVLILQEFSKSKITGRKDNYARGLIKIADDAHFRKIYPSSDLIFIDYGDFLSRSWESIGPYLEILI